MNLAPQKRGVHHQAPWAPDRHGVMVARGDKGQASTHIAAAA